MIFFKFLVCSIIIAMSSSSVGAEYAWIQYAVDNKVFARAITQKKECPLILIDGKSNKMLYRTEQNDLHLKQKIIVCEYDVTNATKVTIDNHNLMMPPKKTNRFVVVGDTGCENSFFNKIYRKQKCDPKNWPFKEVADKIALLKPDFVIHMGDYAYRNKYTTEEDGLKNKQMQWFFFKEELFDPAKKLLEQVPMIFIRGNHEKCDSGGEGWFAFLSPDKIQECSAYTDEYNISINDLNFIVFDSSEGIKGSQYPPEQLKKYQDDFAKIYKNLHAKHWLLIHQPVIPLEKLSDKELFVSDLRTIVVRDAFKDKYSKKIPVSISGHYHLASNVERSSNNFTQLIIGNGGAYIHQSKENKYNFMTDGDSVTVDVEYGYTVFDRLEAYLWKATSYDLKGNILHVNNLSTKP